LVPLRVAGGNVAEGELLKLIVTGEPTGTLAARTTTAMGSCNWFGNRRSMVEKLEPEFAGTLYPPTETICREGGLVGTISGLIVAITGGVPLPVKELLPVGASIRKTEAATLPLTLMEFATRRTAPFAPDVEVCSESHGKPEAYALITPEAFILIDVEDAIVIAPPPAPPLRGVPK
jgi:hypothetical protein